MLDSCRSQSEALDLYDASTTIEIQLSEGLRVINTSITPGRTGAMIRERRNAVDEGVTKFVHTFRSNRM